MAAIIRIGMIPLASLFLVPYYVGDDTSIVAAAAFIISVFSNCVNKIIELSRHINLIFIPLFAKC